MIPTLLVLGTLAGAPHYPDHSRLLVWRDQDGAEHPVRTAADWAKRREHILAHMQDVMGPFPDDSRRVPLDPQTLEVVETESYVRSKVAIAVEPGDRLHCYLLVPKNRMPRSPAVLCLHGTSYDLGKKTVVGLGPRPDRAYAAFLAERGYVTLAPDYVNMGESKFDLYNNGYVSATMKGIWNHMRCIDYLQTLPEVDPERVGALGHSLGGHNSIFVAVFDPRIRCVVSNCGFCSFATYMKGDLTGWSHDGYMPRIRTVYDRRPEQVPFDFPELIAALAPRPFLASAPVRDHNFDVHGVQDCIAAARPVYQLLGAEQNLAAHYPDCDHNFPPEVRAVAFRFLDRHLRRSGGPDPEPR